MKLAIFDYHPIQPFKAYGLTTPFWNVNSDTIIYTWIVLGLIFILCLLGRFALRSKDTIASYLVLNFVASFKTMCTQTLPAFNYKHFAFITSLFSFIFLCTSLSFIPWFEEPTRDLNTTLALGIISFSYIQFYAIKTHGFIEYAKDFFTPFFLMFPLNMMGELATIISISFRLFGNILGGSIVSQLYSGMITTGAIWEMLGILSGMNIIVILFFGLFEGLIQSFVFAMLSLTYLSMAISTDEG
ncbi:MAG: FoF1 ATP synthase subunit a [Candidatus Babeliales bacterium]